MNYIAQTIASVYGPVDSWRLGKSLGVDLIIENSTCSFNCTYCQLGFIQKISAERKLFVPTEKIINDFKASDWKSVDVITLSGSGEPTLATNIGEVICEIKKITQTPIVILTNATLFNDSIVRKNVKDADVIISGTGAGKFITGDKIKELAIIIDAGTSESNGSIVGDVDLESVNGIASFVSPVPGGVGPVTVAILLSNVLKVARIKANEHN